MAGACASIEEGASTQDVDVIGGTADARSYPSAGYFAMHVEASTESEAKTSVPFCGATLIGPQLAITAAHCLAYYTKYEGARGSFWVGFGEAPLLAPVDARSQPEPDEARLRASAFEVEWFASHPGFDYSPESAGRFDIAVLRLAKPVPASIAKPAIVRYDLPTFAPSGSCSGPDASASYTFVGYGRGNVGNLSDPADATFGIRKTLPQCFERGEPWEDLSWTKSEGESEANFLVSRYYGRSSSPNAGHCRGDSGGPAFVTKRGPEDPDELVAILSQLDRERGPGGEFLPDCRPQSAVRMVGFDDGDGTIPSRPRVFIEESSKDAQLATPDGGKVTVSGAFLSEHERCASALGRPVEPVAFEKIEEEYGHRFAFIQRFEKATLALSWRGETVWLSPSLTPTQRPTCE